MLICCTNILNTCSIPSMLMKLNTVKLVKRAYSWSCILLNTFLPKFWLVYHFYRTILCKMASATYTPEIVQQIQYINPSSRVLLGFVFVTCLSQITLDLQKILWWFFSRFQKKTIHFSYLNINVWQPAESCCVPITGPEWQSARPLPPDAPTLPEQRICASRHA